MPIISVATKYLGYREGDMNDTLFGKRLGTNHLPWCHAFASCCANDAGLGNDVVPWTASTDVGMNWFKNKGRFMLKGLYNPKRNDLVYFKTGRSHVGIVEYVSNGYLHTIEGNTSNVVARRTYLLSNSTITGYGCVADYINKTVSSTTVKTKSLGSVPINKVKVIGSASNTNTDTTVDKKKKNKKKEYDVSAELAQLRKFLANTQKKTESLGKYTEHSRTIQHNEVHVYLIQSVSSMYELCVEDGLTVTYERDEVGTFEFRCYRKGIRFQCGNTVIVKVGKRPIFYGYIFTMKEQGSDRFLTITAYDQMRYLKNKSTEVFKKQTLSECITTLGKKFKLNVGKLSDTSYRTSLIADDYTLYEIIEQFRQNELAYKNNSYELFSKNGLIRLVNQKNMYYKNYFLNWNTVGDFDYTSSIDDNYYNKVSLVYENEETGTYEKYEYQDSRAISKYGLLQYTDTIQSQKLGKLKSQALLKFYNRVSRSFTVNDCDGDINVTAGIIIPARFDLEEVKVVNFMIVQKVVHKFTAGNNHTMDLTLKGGIITD